MRIGRMAASLALVLMVSATSLYAAPERGWRGSGGWGMQGAFGRLYNPSTVQTIAGKVVAVERMSPMKGMGPGIHLRVETKEGIIPVHLGPAWYIERQDIGIKRGDRVEVKGSRVTIGGQMAIIAAEVRKGDELLTLRDPDGKPFWSGWRRGR